MENIIRYNSFMKLEKEDEKGDLVLNDKYEPISVYIRIDDKITWMEASGYSLIMMFSEIGGLASFCYAFARISTKKIAKSWFIGTMI